MVIVSLLCVMFFFYYRILEKKLSFFHAHFFVLLWSFQKYFSSSPYLCLFFSLFCFSLYSSTILLQVLLSLFHNYPDPYPLSLWNSLSRLFLTPYSFYSLPLLHCFRLFSLSSLSFSLRHFSFFTHPFISRALFGPYCLYTFNQYFTLLE